jgi:hypothetical protein
MNLTDYWVSHDNVTRFGTASQQVTVSQERINLGFIGPSILYPEFGYFSIGLKR